jgi:hypothetical protein
MAISASSYTSPANRTQEEHGHPPRSATLTMAAAYLYGVAGIDNVTLDNSAAYIQSWLKKLRSDQMLIIHAATPLPEPPGFPLPENGEIISRFLTPCFT